MFFFLLVISVIISFSFSFGLLSVQWDIKGGNISGRICWRNGEEEAEAEEEWCYDLWMLGPVRIG